MVVHAVCQELVEACHDIDRIDQLVLHGRVVEARGALERLRSRLEDIIDDTDDVEDYVWSARNRMEDDRDDA